jgi:PA14 domain
MRYLTSAVAIIAVVMFSLASPPARAATQTSATGTGLRGEYYDNSDFSGLKLTRSDPSVNFNWGSGAPAAGMGADSFSIRWTGESQARFSESYTFYTQSDDGVRLWVNGKLIIDRWVKQTLTEQRGTITLQAGQRYTIKLEYFEYNKSAAVKLLWSSTSQPKQIIPQSQLYPPLSASPTATATTTPSATATATPSPSPTAMPSPTATPGRPAPKLLFGMGPEADGALRTRLVGEAPVRMLTSWYSGPSDLSWMAFWRQDLVPQSYAAGYALHVIVFSDSPEAMIATQYGPACGRTYPLADQFLDDMRQLAQVFAGAANDPPLYVTMFSEFQTYACAANAWNPNSETNAYWQALKERYRESLAIFHQYAPNARVSLGWGGWQTRWDDPATGGGRSMFSCFADVMQASDFQSFQAMQSDSNAEDVRAMVHTLGGYGPVMLAHYKPDNGSQATFESDIQTMLTDTYLSEMSAAGLFAWSFMDHTNLSSSEPIYQFTRTAVQRYGAAP